MWTTGRVCSDAKEISSAFSVAHLAGAETTNS